MIRTREEHAAKNAVQEKAEDILGRALTSIKGAEEQVKYVRHHLKDAFGPNSLEELEKAQNILAAVAEGIADLDSSK